MYRNIYNDRVEVTGASAPKEDVANGDALRYAISKFVKGERFKLWPGRYETTRTSNVVFPPNCLVEGDSPENTILLNGYWGNVDPGCAFELSDGVILRNLTLVSNCDISQQSEVVGFGRRVNPITGATAYLENVKIMGRGFGLYNWSEVGNKIVGRDLYIQAGRRPVFNGVSASGTACEIDIADSEILGDFSLSSYGNTNEAEVGRYLMAFGARGGMMRVRNCYAKLIGAPLCAIVAGYFIDDQGNQPLSSIRASLTQIDIFQHGAITAVDKHQPMGIISVDASGSSVNIAA